ncbi:MAG: 30S ribosomal protein S27e [Nanoarchaeota archaeon]
MKSEPDSKFVKIRCPKCKNEQIFFDKATIKVACIVCGNILAEPNGGKAALKARVLEALQ